MPETYDGQVTLTAEGDVGSRDAVDLLRARQQIGELEAKLAQRDSVIRNLRHRLQDLEEPYWERKGNLEEELDRARGRLVELERARELPREKELEDELRALRSTRTFRYTASARAVYGRLLGMHRPHGL